MSRMSELLKDPTTSRSAAAAIAPRISVMCSRILKILAERAMTPDEVAAEMDCTVLAIRPRFSELAKLELIVRAGVRRANASGMKADVWRLA